MGRARAGAQSIKPPLRSRVYSLLRTLASIALRFPLSIRKKPDSCGSMAVKFDSSANRAASKSWKIASICCASVLLGEGAAEDGVVEDGVIETLS